MEGLLLQDQPIPAYKESRTSFNTNRKPVIAKAIYGNEQKRKGRSFGTCTKVDHLEIHGSYCRSLSCKKPPLLPLPINTSSPNMHERNLSLKEQHQPILPIQNHMLRKLEKREKQHVRKVGPLNRKSKAGLISTSMGPDPSDLPKEVPLILRSVSSIRDEFVLISSCIDKWCGSVSRISSPPPSSLPLPRFSLKKNKVACNAQAEGC